MTAFLCLLIGLCVACPGTCPRRARADADEARKIDLREVVRWAAREPPAVEVAQRRVDAAAARVRAARAAYAPAIVTQADLELLEQQQLYFVAEAPNQKTDARATRLATRASLQWMLLDFGGRPAQVRQAAQARERERQTALGTKLESVRAACELYVALLTTQRLRDDAALSAERRASISSAIARLIDAGIRPRVDLQRAEVEVLAARAALSVLRARTAAQSASLATAMGLEPTTRLEVAELDEALLEGVLTDQQVSAGALRGRPELREQRARIGERAAAVRVARAALWPSLHLTAGVSLQRDTLLRGDGIEGNAFALAGGLSLRWNALDLTAFRDRQVVTAELEVEVAALRDTALRARADAVVSRREVVSATEARAQAGQILEAARIARDAQSRRYQSGEASLLELLDAEQVEQEARSAKILAQRDLDLARIALLDGLGTLAQRIAP